MTNQVNQAFEKWFESQYNHKPKETNGVYMTMFADGASRGYQAATQASEQRIQELKDQLKEITKAYDNLTLNIQAQEQLGYELTASNNQLREAVKDLIGYLDTSRYDHRKVEEQYLLLLSFTPAQSLAEHDNEVIERCAKVCENEDDAELNNSNHYADLVRKLKVNND